MLRLSAGLLRPAGWSLGMICWLLGVLPVGGQELGGQELGGQELDGQELDGQELGQSGFADSGGVKIHYVAQGEPTNPVIVLIHGFPDYWYSWRDQMPALAKHFRVVAMDLRGFNHSGQPEGVDNYQMTKLVADVEAVRQHLGVSKVSVAGHDWGGQVAWGYAMTHPDKTHKLVILNSPHPQGITRELEHNPEQRKASAYAREFQKADAASKIPVEALVFWVKEAEARQRYLKALRRSSMEGMLNYYKANYPKPPYKLQDQVPPVRCPVLIIHGLKDQYLLPGALSGTWKWVQGELTLVTLPEAGHFVHRDQPTVVTQKMVSWLRTSTQHESQE